MQRENSTLKKSGKFNDNVGNMSAIYIVFFHDPKTQIYFVYIFTFDHFSLTRQTGM